MGIDKFMKVLNAHWPDDLAPWIVDIAKDLGLTAQGVMYIVGAIEIVAGIAVAIKPRYAAYVVAAWLAGIIINPRSRSLRRQRRDSPPQHHTLRAGNRQSCICETGRVTVQPVHAARYWRLVASTSTVGPRPDDRQCP
jgi:hypothetical protein